MVKIAKKVLKKIGIREERTRAILSIARDLQAKKLAILMHNKYEELSAKKGWKTQKKTRVYFSELPPANKAVMIGLADYLLKAFGGCMKCYGKGYGTQTLYQKEYADFSGDKERIIKLPTMVFCECARGRQLMNLWHAGEKILIKSLMGGATITPSKNKKNGRN